MEQRMFNIFSGGGVLIIGCLAWIVRSMIKNTEGLTHLREEVREDVKRLENQINRIDARLDYLLIFNRRSIDESSKHNNQ